MAQPQATSTTSKARPVRMVDVIVKACQTDDVSLISEAISVASSPDSRETVEDVLLKAVLHSVQRTAPKVLSYVLANGAKPDIGIPPEIFSLEVLEILLAHGWDINARRIAQQPFLWHVANDGDMVRWCLEHGATVIPKDLGLETDVEQGTDQYGCPPLLEIAGKRSTVATFELLRSNGAQLGHRTLHFAAFYAIDSGYKGDEQPDMPDRDRAELHSERMAMVIHLVDTLGIDPNLLDQPVGAMMGNHVGTPLCYVAKSSGNWDCTDVTQFLLRKGADPRLVMDPAGWDAIELAKRCNNRRFVEVVENWKMYKSRVLDRY